MKEILIPQRIVCLVILLFAIWVISHQAFQNTQNRVLSLLHLIYYIWYTVELALVGLYMLLRGLLGDGIAIVSYSLLWLVFFVGNFIDTKVIIIFCLIVCGLLFVLKKYSSEILVFLKPKRSAASLVMGCLLLFWVFSSLEEDVYKEDRYGREQYNTVFLAYSNYKDIEVEQEYLSISYIPAVVAQSAGLNSPFYNYLGKMMCEYPVVSEVFNTPEFERRKKEYEILQYDILFGNGYCAGN